MNLEAAAGQVHARRGKRPPGTHRRLDAVLEPTKDAVLKMKALVDSAGIANPDAALRQAAGQAFYNTSPFSLRDLRAVSEQLDGDPADADVEVSPRIGITRAADWPLRWFVRDNPFVSRAPRSITSHPLAT